MMTYSIDVTVAATIYIKAETKEQAVELLRNRFTDDCCCELDGIEVSGLRFDDEDLPQISVSPVMTLWGPCHGDWSMLEEV